MGQHNLITLPSSLTYQYKFTNANVIFARIKEELSSYFESGLLDDSLLDIYTKDCIDHLGHGMLKISNTVLNLENGQSDLPDDFEGMREVWICTEDNTPYTLPGSTYQQQVLSTSFKLWENVDVKCSPCQTCANPDIIQAIYRTRNTVLYSWKREKMLMPRPYISTSDKNSLIYVIDNCKIVTPFDNGTLNLVYYVDADYSDGDLQIPNNYYIKKYIEEFIKYKLYFQLFNKVTDESFNQVQVKMQMAKQLSDEAFIEASIEMKKDTTEKKIHRINKQRRELQKFELPRQYHRHRRHI